jgi:hypothetical protein
MPFPGSMVAAPIMAAKQGMKDIAFHAVTDQAKPLLQYVDGAVTGQGSGLVQPATQSAQGVLQGSMEATPQAAGQAMTIGKGEFWGPGASPTGGVAGLAATAAQALPSPGMAGQSLASAQSMLGQSSSVLGSASAMAGSSLGSGTQGQAGSSAASAAAAAMSPSGAGMSTLPGITPGMHPPAPQFTALPTIPSMPRLQDVAARLGALAGPAAAPLTSLTTAAQTSASATVQPVSQFAGQESVPG